MALENCFALINSDSHFNLVVPLLQRQMNVILLAQTP